MKYKVRITKEPLPKAEMGFYSKGKLTNNAFQFPVTFKEGMEPGLDIKKNLGPVDRDKANIEAERGETIITPMGDDAWTKSIPKTFVIGGKKHSKGGTPLSVPEGSFIFSDHLKEKDKQILEMLGKAAKKSGYTYAELSKPYMLNDDIKLMLDPNSDDLTRKTAQMNIQNKIDKLGLIALLQESSKGFMDDEGKVDFPSVAEPYVEKLGLDIEKSIDPFLQAIKAPVQEQAMGQEMNNQMPLMPGMPATPMGPEAPMRNGGLVKYAKGGNVKKYQTAGTIGADERVRYNSRTGQLELVDAQNQVIGYVNELGANQGLRVSRKSVPNDAIIIDKDQYANAEEFEQAKAEAYASKGDKPVVIKSGQQYKLLDKRPVKSEYKGTDLNTLFAGQKGIALNYEYLKDQFNNERVKKELSDRARAALANKGNRGISMTDAEVKELDAKLADPEFAYQMFMDMQKRNLATVAHSRAGNIKDIADHRNAANRGEVANQDFYDSWNKIGVKAPTEAEAKMQQALYIGYKDLILDKNAGKIADQELLNAIKPFKISQFGANDAADIEGTGSGSGISIIDGDYTNTTTGEAAGVDIPDEFFEGDLADENSYMRPKKEAKYRPSNIPKGWTAPDTFEFARATRERFAPKPPQPFTAMPQTYLPNAFLLSPEDQQNQIRGAIGAGLENVRAYAPGPAGLSAGSLVNTDSLTAQSAAIHNANQQIINAHSNNVANILNSGSQNYANLTTGQYDKTTNRIEAIRARNSAAAAEANKAYGQGELNEAAYQASALTHPNYLWNPWSQDYAGFIPSGPIDPTMNSQNTAYDLFSDYRKKLRGVSDNVVWSIAKADAGIKDPEYQIPDYLQYTIPG